jgi:hypothetical protein
MSEVNSGVIKTTVKKAAKKVEYSTLVENLIRVGFGVRGVIYVLMGLFALQLVLGTGGSLASPQDAIAAIGKQPIGRILLWVVLLGLISYALWGVLRAVFDLLHKGNDLKGLLERSGFLVSAIGYAILVVPTFAYITGKSSGTGGPFPENIISAVMKMPLGRWAIGILGLVVVAAGVYQVYLGLKTNFDRQFQIYAMKPKQAKLATNVARFGTAARGVVFAAVGFLIGLAAYQSNPSQPIGMDAALGSLLKLPYGLWLLGIIAVGLVAFGFYSMMSALWFRLKR